MKKVAILANYRDSFSISEEKKFSYSELTRIFRENGLDLKRVSIHSFNQEKGVFTDYVDIDKNGEFKIFHEEYKPDIIWNRSSDGQIYFHSILKKQGYNIVPSSYISSIAGDKYEMYCFLKDFQPNTLLLKDFFTQPELRRFLTNKIVLKPIRSNSGLGIIFITQDELLEKNSLYEGLGSLFIVQEFLDFHEGIPCLAEGVHDIRLVYIGGKYSHATLRQPKKGGLKSNVGSGGEETLLTKESIPIILFQLVSQVMVRLDLRSREEIFSIDFGYVAKDNRWYIFELNFSPGIYFISDNQEDKKLFHSTYFSDLTEWLNYL